MLNCAADSCSLPQTARAYACAKNRGCASATSSCCRQPNKKGFLSMDTPNVVWTDNTVLILSGIHHEKDDTPPGIKKSFLVGLESGEFRNANIFFRRVLHHQLFPMEWTRTSLSTHARLHSVRRPSRQLGAKLLWSILRHCRTAATDFLYIGTLERAATPVMAKLELEGGRCRLTTLFSLFITIL
jgi:hypothetical protein